MRRATFTLRRVVAIYAAGIMAGTQGALYLADRYDDGVADWRSAAIALAMVAVGAVLIAQSFRSRTHLQF